MARADAFHHSYFLDHIKENTERSILLNFKSFIQFFGFAKQMGI